MKIDFNKGKITLVIVPFDLRYGFYRLAQISAELLHIWRQHHMMALTQLQICNLKN